MVVRRHPPYLARTKRHHPKHYTLPKESLMLLQHTNALKNSLNVTGPTSIPQLLASLTELLAQVEQSLTTSSSLIPMTRSLSASTMTMLDRKQLTKSAASLVQRLTSLSLDLSKMQTTCISLEEPTI